VEADTLPLMLKALLHRKLGRSPRPDEKDVEPGEKHVEPAESAWNGLTSREDPLTSAVFERIAYLEPHEAWTLICDSAERPSEEHFHVGIPTGSPTWRFWPHLSPGVDGFNARHVEPDVLVAWGNVVLVIEAKHSGDQIAAQWREQVLAVQADEDLAGKQVIFIAAGGVDRVQFTDIAEEARRRLGDKAPPFWLLRWTTLRQVAEERSHLATPGAAAILRDIIAALEAWGYRRRFGFDSLPGATRRFHVTTTAADLKEWK
jgi:hypothetical protein